MPISTRGLTLIKTFEGFSPAPYLCPAGYLTIGYGHVVRAGDARVVDEEEASELLAKDVQMAEQAIARLIIVPLSQPQRDALISFTFNLGAAALQRSTLRRKINNKEHGDVPAELMRWVYAGGRMLPGLVARRKAEGQLYASQPA